MHLHEYQTKEILKKYGLPVPDFVVINSVEEVEKALTLLGTSDVVLKIQVHAGGRGKAGGVKLARGQEEACQQAKHLLGLKIVNNQTGPQGIVTQKVLLTPRIPILKEYYLAAIMDRKEACGVLIASAEGGMEIEEIAKSHPDKILKLPLPLDGKFKKYQLYPLVKQLGWEGKVAEKGVEILQKLALAFVETDAELLEINPLVLTADQELLALDAKLSLDENALFRHPDFQRFYDPTQISPREAKAKEYDLAYIALEGNIGCMVNGAGLAMATMDLIQAHGGKPANFLDVGGGASKEKVAEGFKIILADTQVKAILVNIFGGIMNCELLAEGIIYAAKELGVMVPLIVRMEGTNVEGGKKKLAESGLNIILSHDLKDAAEKVVRAAL